MNPDHYDIHFADEDDDDEDLDDDVDGYDGLSDFEDDDDVSHSRNTLRHNATDADTGESKRQRSVSEGNFSLGEPMDDNRRDHHNQLERKRRASIKTSYNDLREVIPSLRGSKASRAVILQRAVECIEELVKVNRDHTHCVETLKRQNDALESKVLDLQRHIQRLDGEEAATASCSTLSSCVPMSGGGTLRLLSGSITPAGTSGSGSSGVPVYRLLPHDSSEKPGTSNALSNRPVAPNGTSHSSSAQNALSSRTRTSLAASSAIATCAIPSGYTGMNALSAAVSLVTSTNSAFSSTSSSTGSNGDPPQSSSQRSSPGCLSSSSSTASSFNQCYIRQRDQSEEPSVVVGVTSSGDTDPGDASGNCTLYNSKRNGASLLRSSPTSRTSSPPSILLTLPIRPLTASAQSRLSCKVSSDPEITLQSNESAKRRRIS